MIKLLDLIPNYATRLIASFILRKRQKIYLYRKTPLICTARPLFQNPIQQAGEFLFLEQMALRPGEQGLWLTR